MVNSQKVKYAKFVKILTILPSLLVCLGLYNQSFAQTSASSISGFRELLVSPSILPSQLKADSDAQFTFILIKLEQRFNNTI
jgi:hypothetical protein